MTAPRLEIDLGKLTHNARTLVDRLAPHGISVTGVTKATLGSAPVARALLQAGVRGIGDSRIENIENMAAAPVDSPMTLIRSPMLSQVTRVVRSADVSCNTEVDVIAALATAAQHAHTTHAVVLMVELGDLREGILPGELIDVVRTVLSFPNIVLHGIGTNLACRSGVCPDPTNMAELSRLADSIESTFDLTLAIVSGGSSANLDWVFSGAPVGRINDLRLGESIMLGCEPLHREPIEGLHLDAFRLVAEVIESKTKPTSPTGTVAQNAFGEADPVVDRGTITQTIVALGQQDTDPYGLTASTGITIIGASSDHLILDPGSAPLPVGAEVTFVPTYGALVRAMTSPFVEKVVHAPRDPRRVVVEDQAATGPHP